MDAKDLKCDIERLISEIATLQHKVELLSSICEKALHVSSLHYDLYGQRSRRPYYTLNDNWGLTSLDTGQLFFVNTEDRNITPWLIMGGHWEPNVGRVLIEYTQPGMVVIDAGAHLGYYTIKLGAKIGLTGYLFAFEPNPEVNAMCVENIKINGLSSNVMLYKFALGDINTTATLTRSNSNMASANLVGDQDVDMSVEVDVRKLDDVIDPNTEVDLIKLDAEGYEAKILKGATGLLARSPRCAVMIEVGLERWERQSNIDELLDACGGGGRQVYAVRDDGTLEKFETQQIRPFLLTCAFHENYFFIAREQDVLERIGHLVRT